MVQDPDELGQHDCRVCRLPHGADFDRLSVVISTSMLFGIDDHLRTVATRHFDLDLVEEATLEYTYLQLQKYKNFPIPCHFLIILPGIHDLARDFPVEDIINWITYIAELLTRWNPLNTVAFSRLPYSPYMIKIYHRFQNKGDKHCPRVERSRDIHAINVEISKLNRQPNIAGLNTRRTPDLDQNGLVLND